jgi:hypothetical protein
VKVLKGNEGAGGSSGLEGHIGQGEFREMQEMEETILGEAGMLVIDESYVMCK